MGGIFIKKKILRFSVVFLLIILFEIILPLVNTIQIPFYYRVFEPLNGYEHSRYKPDEWVYGSMWIKRFADWNLELFLGVEGQDGIVSEPFLYVMAVDDSFYIRHRALQFSIRLDGKEYTFDLLQARLLGFAPLGYNGREMVKSLSMAKDISIHITYNDFELFMDQNQIGDISGLVEVSKNLCAKDVWVYGDLGMMELGDVRSRIKDDTQQAN
jgi:hypothetical protein